LVTSGLVAVWYGDDYSPSNGYWVSRVGGYTGAPVTSSYPPRGCILWNSTWYSGPTGIWSNWQQCWFDSYFIYRNCMDGAVHSISLCVVKVLNL